MAPFTTWLPYDKGTAPLTLLTLHLPDDLAARLAALPSDEVNAYAVAALADLVRNGGDDADVLTPDDLAAIGAGLADLDAGRVKPAAAVFAGMDAHLAELKRTKQQQQTA